LTPRRSWISLRVVVPIIPPSPLAAASLGPGGVSSEGQFPERVMSVSPELVSSALKSPDGDLNNMMADKRPVLQ